MECLDDRGALALFEDRIAAAERTALIAHLDGCAWCRRLVAEIGRSATTGPGTGGEPPDLARDATVGRFAIEHELGRGGMGVVYAAYDPELDRRVALKRFHRTGDATEERELEARLYAEARTMARLAHPNVVPVYEVGRAEGALFLAMELVEGDTLRDWLAERPRSIAEITRVLAGAAAGLGAAHAEGVVHRDFKPENVLVGADGRARVTDFGLARTGAEQPHTSSAGTTTTAGTTTSTNTSAGTTTTASTNTNTNTTATAGTNTTASGAVVRARGSGATQTGALVGTPAYMAPEQLAGRAASAASDQFSFCVVLYEALWGERPFTGDSLAALARAIERGLPPEPKRRPRPPAHVRGAIARGLSAEPGARFPSIAALAARLARESLVRRHPFVAVGIALVAGAAAVTGALALHGSAAAPCDGASRELAGIWDGNRHVAVDAAFVRSGSPLAPAALPRIESALDRYADAWVAAHGESCTATRVRAEASAAELDRRMACLSDRKRALGALVELLASTDARAIEHADAAVAALPDPATCLRPGGADDDPDPIDPAARAEAERLRAALAHATALHQLGRETEALAAVGPIADGTAALPRLHARAVFERGEAEQGLGRAAPAAADFQSAAYAAEAAKSDAVAARAATLAVSAFADAGQLHEARDAARLAEATTQRLGDLAETATLDANVAWLEIAEGDPRAAERDARRATETGCRGRPVTARCLHLDVLGVALFREGKLDDARATYERQADLLRSELGPDHPLYARALDRLGTMLYRLGRLDDALADYGRARAIYERSADGGGGALAALLSNTANAQMARGRLADAEANIRRAVALHEQTEGAEHPDVAASLVSLANVLSLEGRGADAVPQYRRAVAIFEKSLGPEHPMVAAALSPLGRQLLLDGHARDAEPVLARAVAIRAAHPGDPAEAAGDLVLLGETQAALHEHAAAAASLERALRLVDVTPVVDPGELAEVRYDLSDELWQAGGDRARARGLAEQALAYVTGGTRAGSPISFAAADVRQWLAAHR